MSKQSKEDFLKNVKYWAQELPQRDKWVMECDERENPVDLDPQLRAVYDDCAKYERLMCEAAAYLSKLCKEKVGAL